MNKRVYKSIPSTYSTFAPMKVLMVCLGNICRSSMAEGILRDKIKKTGVEMEVESASTSNYHIGDPPDQRAIEVMKRKGHDISDLRGRQFQVADFDRFDCIYTMDKENYKDVMAVARNEADKSKVNLLMNVTHPGENMVVTDPYFGDEEGFEKVYDQLDTVTDALITEARRESSEDEPKD